VPWLIGVVGRWWLEAKWLRMYRDVPVLTISQSSYESLTDYGLRCVEIVPVGLATTDDTPPVEKNTRPTVAFVGRLAANKRPDDALRAFDLARSRVPHAQMWVIGTGPLEEKLRARWESDDVVLWGRVSEERRNELMARATALAVTSVREGWGMVVSEAAAVGTPAIGYNVAGLRDSIQAACGVLVPEDVQLLADAIAENVPRWHLEKPDVPAWAGVQSWDDVSESIFDRIGEAVGFPTT
jgi:glycosyltransferase involved in cell wall biosynthesis